MFYSAGETNGGLTMAENDWAELIRAYEAAERKRLDEYMLRRYE